MNHGMVLRSPSALLATLLVCAILPASARAAQIYLSTASNATIGGLTFRDGDIVQYNPLTNSATLFFSEDLFSTNVNVDGFSVLANGHYIISTVGNATLGGLTFRDGDLAEYNPVTGTASLFFSENAFSADEDIDAVHVLSDGSILLSTRNGASIGGITFLDGDVVRYVPSTNTASILLPESTFTGNVNVDGVFLAPEPDTGLLLALGLAGLALRRKPVRGLRAR